MKALIDALMEPAAWPFPVDRVEHLETHISHVFLVGDLAYKLKKPLDLGFLDFSTLERRRFFCEEEVRLNSRMAPGIYLAAVPIVAGEEGILVEGEGEPMEWAVKMQRFDQEGLLDRHPLAGEIVDVLADTVADFHRTIPSAPDERDWGRPGTVWFPVGQNFSQIRDLGLFPQLEERLDALEGRTRDRFEELESLIARRREQGFTRECHGDMHLGNIAWSAERVLVFDGIEFNPDLRWIDVANDIAFLLMDLKQRGHAPMAWRFLNRYLERTGDYEGVPLLPFYEAYRAMVRAKVAGIRLSQEGGDPRQAEALRREFEGYLEYAERCLQPPGQPALIITHGLSGSGKSRLCRGLRERLGLIHIQSDVERKRLFGLQAHEDSRSTLQGGIYTPEASRRTYRRLEEMAARLLESGFSVLVDATFLHGESRERFRELAERTGARWRVLALEAPPEVLRRRVSERARSGNDPSEAGVEVLEHQLAGYRPLEAGQGLVRVDASRPFDVELLAQELE